MVRHYAAIALVESGELDPVLALAPFAAEKALAPKVRGERRFTTILRK
jgi:hypothetical protein